MLDIFKQICEWVDAGENFALATVAQTWGSSPRQIGSSMAIRPDSTVIGSVSGGCVENDVIEIARQVLNTGKPHLAEYGVSNETAWSVGLTCGGRISVLIEIHPAFATNTTEVEIWPELRSSLANGKPAILLTQWPEAEARHLLVFQDGKHIGDWQESTSLAIDLAISQYRSRQSATIELEGQRTLVQIFPKPDRLVIIGAAHISIPLVGFAKKLGFSVIMIDPRRIFANASRFQEQPDQMIAEWPQEVLPGLEVDADCYAVLLTHDPKIDDPALHNLLETDVRYIGALGSRKTHEKRRDRLKEAGFSDEQIARIRGPVGLDINAKTPEEIALSIMAEIVQVKRALVSI